MNCPHCEDVGELNGEVCRGCCEHAELDHFICLYCGEELDPGVFIDRAMDGLEDR